MFILLSHLIIKCNEVFLVKADTEVKTTSESQFRLFKPKTWPLQPIVKQKVNYFVEIHYMRGEQRCQFTYYTGDDKSCQDIISNIALQMKTQTDAGEQEALDKVFENAVSNA